MTTFDDFAALGAHVGQPLPPSDWLTVTQAQINLFAQATGDHQWIHVDEARAQAGPFGSTIAHGFLTLSLLPQWFENAIAVRGVRMGVNYGLNKVRFLAPVRVHSRLRAHFQLLHCEAIANDGVQCTWEVTVECEGAEKPVCVAQSLLRFYL